MSQGFYYDLVPGDRVRGEMASVLDEWLYSMVGKDRVISHLIKSDSKVIQRIFFADEETRNLFALYVSGLDLYRK